MKKAVRMMGLLSVAVGLGCLTSGCLGGISLFSSTHTHYEAKPGLDERVKVLEQKVKVLESGAPTTSVPAKPVMANGQ